MRALSSVHFAHLPIWSEGNAYLNGAKAWCKEKNNFTDNTFNAYVEIEKNEKGEYRLKTNIYEALGNFHNRIITSDVLGKAFEPEERFENTDGTDIVFNCDYLDGHRSLATIPGPFATPEDAGRILYRELTIK